MKKGKDMKLKKVKEEGVSEGRNGMTEREKLAYKGK